MQTSDTDLDLVLTESLKLKHLGYAHLESLSLTLLWYVPLRNTSAESTVYARKLVSKKHHSIGPD
jgi:hypothetical protein